MTKSEKRQLKESSFELLSLSQEASRVKKVFIKLRDRLEKRAARYEDSKRDNQDILSELESLNDLVIDIESVEIKFNETFNELK